MLFAQVHLGSEGAVRHPLARGAGCSFFKHLVDLLKSKTLGFRDEEVGEEESDAAEATPHKEDVRAETGRIGTVSNQVGSDNTNDTVPEPAPD